MLNQLFTHPNGNVYKVTKLDGLYVRCVKQLNGVGQRGKPSKFTVVEVSAWLNPSDLPFTTDNADVQTSFTTFAGTENPQEIAQWEKTETVYQPEGSTLEITLE